VIFNDEQGLNALKPIKGYSGLLFVGDPHVWSKKPGRRLDKNFSQTVFDKLSQAVEIANTRNLYMIILGDLFHDSKDYEPYLLVNLLQIFKKLNHQPLVLVGNHEKKEFLLTDNTTLAVLRESESIKTIETTGFAAKFEFLHEGKNKKLIVGGTPYGQEIPTEIITSSEYGDNVFWITHHDLAFSGAYPNSQELREIKGCSWVCNGHMHLTKPTEFKGITTWFNPGNIIRLSIDSQDHIPSVWEWSFDFNKTLKQHVLKYEKNIFDNSGYIVENIKNDFSDLEINIGVNKSEFVELLKKDELTDAKKTDDGTIMLEDMEKLFKEYNTDEDVSLFIKNVLFKRVLDV